MTNLTARAVVGQLEAAATTAELDKVRRRLAPGEPAIGVRMKSLFDIAKSATALPDEEWGRLVAEPAYEARLAAFCILDFRARRALGDAALRAAYLDHHHRITTWDMVDRAAPRVVGAAVAADRRYALLHELAGSPDPLRRRTAITAPLWFARYGGESDLAAGFELAALLCADPEPQVHKAAGIFLAHAGDRDPDGLTRFLGEHSASMPATARRTATRPKGRR